jgi:hypothetical protein
MNLLKINDFLTKGMIGIFVSIIPLTLITILLPVVGYAVAILMMLLFVVTFANLVIATILIVMQMNELIENFFKNYEQKQ